MPSARLRLPTRPLFLLGLLIILALVPIWGVRYLALHDYYHHLLEAQVVAHYEDPGFAYQADYQIHDGWYLSSNALSTLLMIGLGYLLPIEIAGKIALSIYIVLFAGGVFWLLTFLGQPRWLLMLLPVLIYNVTFTWGWLNWSYGFIFTLLALLCYLHWRASDSGWLLVLLAGLSLLTYLAHGFAWGMCIIIVCALAVVDHIPLRRYLLLSLSLSSAVPFLLVARPALALLPCIVAGSLWLIAALIRRQRLRPTTLLVLGAAIDLCFLAGIVIFYRAGIIRAIRDAIIPSYGYLFSQKLFAPVRLLTLPHFELPVDWSLVGANILLLILLAAIGGLLIYSSIVHYRTHGVADWRWLALFGLLVFGYPLLPSYTPDIAGIPPRYILLIYVVGLCWVRFPASSSQAYRVLIGLLIAVGIFWSATTIGYAQRYDRAAQGWFRTLSALQPLDRVLVLGDATLPVPRGGWYVLTRVSQSMDQNAFVTSYTTEHGGFVTNTLWNGPLLPRDPTLMLSSWFDEEDPFTSITEQCNFIRNTYTSVVAWGITDPDLLKALDDCFGPPIGQGGPIVIWRP